MGEKIVNVEQTMHELVSVGKFLEVADLGSDSLKCNTAVKAMMCDYQTLVHDSSRTLFEFRSNSLKAISNQKDAVELFNEKEFLDCLETISGNKDLSQEMAQKSSILALQANNLKSKAVEALTKASEEDHQLKEKNDQLKQEIEKLKADEAANKKSTEMMNELTEDLKQKVTESWSRAEKQIEAENSKGVWSAILDGVEKVLTGAAAAASAVASNTGGAVGGAVQAGIVALQRNKKLLPSDDVMKDIFKGAEDHFQIYTELEKTIKEQISEKSSELTKNLNNLTKDEKTDLEAEIKRLRKEQERLTERYKKFAKKNSDAEPDPKSKSAKVDSLVKTLIDQARNNEQQLLLIQKKNAESAADLAKILHRIKTMEVDAGDLETAINMIKLLINVLGRIETTFQNVKTFWDIQTTECTNLSKLSDEVQLKIEQLQKKEKDIYLKQAKRKLHDSTIKWITLFKINHDAFLAIEGAKSTIDHVMQNLGNLDDQRNVRSRQGTFGSIHL